MSSRNALDDNFPYLDALLVEKRQRARNTGDSEAGLSTALFQKNWQYIVPCPEDWNIQGDLKGVEIITRYIKNGKHYKTVAWTRVLYVHSSFISCFTSVQWAPPATRTTSSRYGNSSQRRLNMSWSTVLFAAVIRSFLSSLFAGHDGKRTLSVTYPHKKKPHVVRSGHPAGQGLRVRSTPLLPIHYWGTFSFRQTQTPRCQWESAPSCWKMKSFESACSKVKSQFSSVLR